MSLDMTHTYTMHRDQVHIRGSHQTPLIWRYTRRLDVALSTRVHGA